MPRGWVGPSALSGLLRSLPRCWDPGKNERSSGSLGAAPPRLLLRILGNADSGSAVLRLAIRETLGSGDPVLRATLELGFCKGIQPAVGQAPRHLFSQLPDPRPPDSAASPLLRFGECWAGGHCRAIAGFKSAGPAERSGPLSTLAGSLEATEGPPDRVGGKWSRGGLRMEWGRGFSDHLEHSYRPTWSQVQRFPGQLAFRG